jgi:hypothetical protein
MEERIEVRLAPQKVSVVVNKLNKVLDEERVFGQELNKQVIKELIVSNLTRNTTIKLIEELEQMPISDWND